MMTRITRVLRRTLLIRKSPLNETHGIRSRNRGIYIAVSLKKKFKRHLPGEFHDCSWVFWSWHCSRKGARRTEEERKKKTKMTKLDFHRFQVRHFSNNFERSPCYCKAAFTRQRYQVKTKTFLSVLVVRLRQNDENA